METFQKQFFSDFESKVSDTVESIDLSCINASKLTFSALDIKTTRSEFWGLTVFCKNNIYFYAPASESPMIMFFRTQTKQLEQKETIINLTNLENIKISLPIKKWYNIVFSNLKHSLDFSFTKNTNNFNFSLSTTLPAIEIKKKFDKII